MRRSLDELVAITGLARRPEFVVDPAAGSTGAVVFGRTSRPTVCLHGGLLAMARRAPAGYRAVLLHELAHIRNRDVTISYAAVAAGRVFLVAVLVPYVLWSLTHLLGGSHWAGDVVVHVSGLVLAAVLAGLTQLLRADVLRSREFYADRAALAWGADPAGWAIPPGTRPHRVLGALRELWDPHPGWLARRSALADPSILYAERALPMFLTGMAAVLLGHDLDSAAAQNVVSVAMRWASVLVPSALVVGVAGVALVRAVSAPVDPARRMPTGLRTGLALGLGMAAGQLVGRGGLVTEWLPTRPELLVLQVLAGVVFAWWFVQCARLWTATAGGRGSRPAMSLCLLTGWLVLTAWFDQWQGHWSLLLTGSQTDASGMSAFLAQRLGVTDPHSTLLSVVSVVLPDAVLTVLEPLVVASVGAMSVLALLAWVIRPGTEALRALAAGLVGGVLGLAGTLIVRWYLPIGPSAVLNYLSLLLWWLVVLVCAAALAALSAATLVGRCRLVAALIAAHTSVVVGWSGCWRSGSDVLVVLPTALVAGAAIAVPSAAAVLLCSRLWTRQPRPASDAATPVGGPALRWLAARRWLAGTVSVAVIGATTLASVATSGGASVAPDDPAKAAQQIFAMDNVGAVSPDLRRVQLGAWWFVTGADLVKRLIDPMQLLEGALPTVVAPSTGVPREVPGLRPACVEFGQAVPPAGDYLRVPDPRLQRLWQTAVDAARKSSGDCTRALDRGDGRLFTTAAAELSAAMRDFDSFMEALVDAFPSQPGR